MAAPKRTDHELTFDTIDLQLTSLSSGAPAGGRNTLARMTDPVDTSGAVNVADVASSAATASWVSAWATVVTAAVAVLAVALAWWQIREARAARAQTRALADEVAQPYVVAFMESDPTSPENIHLVVRNFGQTAALDVKFTTDPELRSALYKGLEQEVIRLPETIPVLAPGQEWRTFWDAGRERGESELPSRHDMSVTYRDTHAEHTTKSILDFAIFRGRTWTDYKTMHDLARAVIKIDKKLGEFGEGFQGGLRVYSRDGDAKDRRLADERRARAAEVDSERATRSPDG